MSAQNEESSELSALRANIESKGKNSYYYAHGPKIDGPAWDGKEEPRLLSSASGDATPKSRPSRTLTEYAWGDGKKIVTIYLDFEDAENIPDEIISVSTTAESVSFSITDHIGADYKLLIDNLQVSRTNSLIGKLVSSSLSLFVFVLRPNPNPGPVPDPTPPTPPPHPALPPSPSLTLLCRFAGRGQRRHFQEKGGAVPH